MFLKAALSVSLLLVLAQNGAGHSYHGGACPTIDPMSDFEMDRMLGLWHVIQKTDTYASCITYNFTKTENEYLLEQDKQVSPLGLTSLKQQYQRKGHLVVPDKQTPANMTVKFDWNPAGSASYIVFMTDYHKYAAIFTCQNLPFTHRQSVTILSRDTTLDQQSIDKVLNKLTYSNIDPEFSVISHKNCTDDDTISHSIAKGIKKTGETISEGLEYVSNGAQKIYHSVVDSDEKKDEPVKTTDSKNDWLP